MDLVVFCYNRPDKLKMCLNAIDLSYVNKLWIFCDGAKQEHDEAVKKTIDVASNFTFHNKIVVARESNYGTPRNVISGLDQVFETTESCFILEDDCIVKPQAYKYIDWALKTFRDNKRIFSINTMAPLNRILNKIASIIVKDDIIACNRVYGFWGWATWADRWQEFRQDLEPFKNPYGATKDIPFKCGNHMRLTMRLYDEGKVGGWDARLLVLTMYSKRLHLHPRVSLMRNIGLDGTGSHFGNCQQRVEDKAGLEFSDYLPLLNAANYKDIGENKLVGLLGLLYTSVVWIRGKAFIFIPKSYKWKVRKLLLGRKIKSSQF